MSVDEHPREWFYVLGSTASDHFHLLPVYSINFIDKTLIMILSEDCETLPMAASSS